MKWLRTHLILASEVFYFNTLGKATAHSVHPISDGGLHHFQSGSSFKAPPSVYEAGMSYAIVSAAQNILSGFRKSFPKYGELVFCCSVLSYVYGTFSADLLNRSSLHFLFPGVIFPDTLSPSQKTGIERGVRMISDVIAKTYGDDLEQISRLFPDVRAVQIGKTLYLCGISETVSLISKKYGIDWESGPWQK